MERGSTSDAPTHHQTKKNRTIDPIQAPGKCPNGEMVGLPDEIVIEILSRLPVKSLLKFRCVCKSWLSLISSPQFVKSQLEISAKDPTFSNHRIMFTISQPRFKLNHCSVVSLMYEHSTEALPIPYPKKHPHRAVWVVGSCNGLISLAMDEKDLFLWNPSLRISKKLPPVNVILKPAFYNIFGFGYSVTNDDYKVLGIFFTFEKLEEYTSVVMVYSLRSDSWKRIEDFKGGVPLDDSGKFASGKLHFGTTSGLGMDFRWHIVSFDLDSEIYGTVEQPNYGEGNFASSLGVLGEHLCILCDYQKTHADVWVLKEYGIKESWTKVVTIPYFEDPGRLYYSKPLCMLPSGEILFVFGGHLAIYNPKDNSLRRPEMNNLGDFLEADIYIESLVPLIVEN